MDSKNIRKGIGRFFGWMGLEFFSLLIKIMPEKLVYALAGGVSAIGYRIAGKQRKIAFETLDIAFGNQKTPGEKEQIARDCFTFLAKGALELIFLMDRPQILKQRVSFAGEENLKNSLAGGNGVILVSAHFGNFPLLMARLSLEGYKVAGIMRPMRDEKVEKIFMKKRSRLGIKTVYSQPRQACVNESIRVLRDNGLLFIPIDQNFGTGGVFVEFFGKKAATATGPIVLARRTGAKLIPCFIVREKDDTQKIIFEPPMEIEGGPTDEETVRVNIQKLTNIIESYIRKYPPEWGWIHRRWKTKPA